MEDTPISNQETGSVVIVRPHPLVLIVALSIGPAVTLTVVRAAQRTGSVDWPVVGIFGLLMIWMLALLVRERVEVGVTTVRIRRLLSSDTLDRSDVVAVHRSGGKGKPPFIALGSERETSRRDVDLTPEAPLPRPTRTVAMTSLLFPSRMARALGVPCRSWSGSDPGPPPQITFRRVTTRDGLLTWLLTLCVVALVGLIVIGGALSVASR